MQPVVIEDIEEYTNDEDEYSDDGDEYAIVMLYRTAFSAYRLAQIGSYVISDGRAEIRQKSKQNVRMM